MPYQSLFAAVTPEPRRSYSRETMLAMSHAIEDQALAAGNVRLVLALFQQGRNLERAAARYRRIRDRADQVVALGYDLQAVLVPGIEAIELAPNDPLRDEWAIVVVGDRYQALLTTREEERDREGTGRRYLGAWTFARGAVQMAARVLRDIIRGYRPDLDLEVPSGPGGVSSETLEAGAARMLAYVERNAERVRSRERDLVAALDSLERANEEMVTRLAMAAEQKDKDTSGHMWRVASYTAAIAAAMRLPATEVQRLTLAAPMHDIGKVHIDDAVLQKPGRLTEEEFAHIKTHTLAGARILEGSPSALLQAAERIARSHHERWDGKGYPEGRRGRAIPLEARIVAVADVFDALTVRRPYKEPFPFDQSLSMIRDLKGEHFDPDAVDAFLAVERDIRRIHATAELAGTSHAVSGGSLAHL